MTGTLVARSAYRMQYSEEVKLSAISVTRRRSYIWLRCLIIQACSQELQRDDDTRIANSALHDEV